MLVIARAGKDEPASSKNCRPARSKDRGSTSVRIHIAR